MDRSSKHKSVPDDAQRLQAILDAAVDAILTIDEVGVIESANPAAEKLFGYSIRELVGRNVRMLMPQPYRDEHDGYLANYLKTGRKQIIGKGREAIGQRRDGSTFPIYLSVSETLLGDRRLYTGIVHDVSERDLALTELQFERDFATNLLDITQAIVLVLDSGGHVLRFNRFAEELTGYSIDEAQGSHWISSFLPERERERILAVFARAIAGERVHGVINAVKTRDGAEREIRWYANAIRDSNGEITTLLSIGHDITDLRNAQRQLVQTERLAAIGQMVTGLAHESRNALQRAQACLDVLSLDVSSHPEQLDLTRRAKTALDDLHRLYEEVKNYAAPIRLERANRDLSQIWKKVWRDLTGDSASCPSPILDEICPEQPVCHVDGYRIEQVFRNVLENSIAAAASTIHVDCRRTEVSGMAAWRITFRDDGPGFDAEPIDSIFEPFFTTRQKGTGLGLAICRRIIETHGGTISAQQSLGGGAEVILVIPQ